MILIRSALTVLLIQILFTACSSSQPEMDILQKPGWINTPQRGEFVGIAEASSEDEARKNARIDALAKIRLSVHGGTLFSLTELDQMESDEGVS